jgi:hypothetical protein
MREGLCALKVDASIGDRSVAPCRPRPKPAPFWRGSPAVSAGRGTAPCDLPPLAGSSTRAAQRLLGQMSTQAMDTAHQRDRSQVLKNDCSPSSRSPSSSARAVSEPARLSTSAAFRLRSDGGQEPAVGQARGHAVGQDVASREALALAGDPLEPGHWAHREPAPHHPPAL